MALVDLDPDLRGVEDFRILEGSLESDGSITLAEIDYYSMGFARASRLVDLIEAHAEGMGGYVTAPDPRRKPPEPPSDSVLYREVDIVFPDTPEFIIIRRDTMDRRDLPAALSFTTYIGIVNETAQGERAA